MIYGCYLLVMAQLAGGARVQAGPGMLLTAADLDCFIECDSG